MSNKSLGNLKNYFSAIQAADFSHMSLAMVNYLCRNSLVVPAVGRKRGKGIERKYSFGDIVILKSVAKLLEAGVSVLKLKKALVNLRKMHADITLEKMPGSFLITDGKDVYLRQSSGILELLGNGQLSFAFVVDIESVRQDAVIFAKNNTVSKKEKLSDENRSAA